MYAAAGGASLASRQARQRQRQQKKNQQLQAKLHPPKAAAAGAAGEHGGASTPTRGQSRQFHQLPTNYLRTPQAMGRKLSATYTTQSKLLLPIDEGDTQSVLQLRMHSHSHAHGHGPPTHHAHAHAHSHMHHSHLHAGAAAAAAAGPPQTPYQQFAASHGRVSPKLVHRHSGSSAGFQPAEVAAAAASAQLHKSATATLPLVSQMEATPPATPSGAVGVKTTATSLDTAPHTTASTSAAAAGDDEFAGAAAMFVPHHDAIIVTPATPMASPGHVAKLRPTEDLPESAAERQPLTAADAYEGYEDEPMQPPTGPLERKCSVYRMRRSDAFEHESGLKRQLRELQFTSAQQTQYEPLLTDEPQLLFKGLTSGSRKWQLCAYCEEGICVCEHIEKNTYVTTPTPPAPPQPPPPPPECAQGRAAWLERGRRCSVQEQQQQQATCHRRWVKRNRIQDASLGGSSDDEDFLGVLRGPSTFANAFLYVGLGTVALGLVIAFVGTGEKGFKTVELRLIGPSLIGLGLICCILRILFCICPSHCISSNKKTRKKNGNKIDADHTTSLLRGESKRVSIARGPTPQPKYPIAHKRSQSKMLNEGMEALRQIATTSLFMQNEQKTAINRVVPIINEPLDNGQPLDAPLEMKKLQTALNVCEMSDEDDVAEEDEQQPIAKHTTTTRTAITTKTAVTSSTTKPKATTTLSTVDEKPDSKLVRQRITLQQQQRQLQQQQQQQQQTSGPTQSESQSHSLSSSSTVKDSLDGVVVVEETSLMTQPLTLPPPAEARPPLPSSSSAGALPRLKNTITPMQRPGISTGATPKTTTLAQPYMPTTSSNSSTSVTSGVVYSRLPTSLSQPSSYDMPPAQPHTYAGAATVRGPLGMAMSASSSVYALPPTTATQPTSFLPATTTTISLLPLPAPPTTASASIPGQVLEGSNTITSSLNILQPTAAAAGPGQARPASATAAAATTSTFSGASFMMPSASASVAATATEEHRSHPSSVSTAVGRGSGGLLLAPPAPSASKLEPELVLSPAKLGQ